ncbi:MAG TPA: hypothetical protein ENJ19_10010 [Gammaproteobacteria bacterium]|nr:hypothetical protein [Gammaproteobacteria bacterium]
MSEIKPTRSGIGTEELFATNQRGRKVAAPTPPAVVDAGPPQVPTAPVYRGRERRRGERRRTQRRQIRRPSLWLDTRNGPDRRRQRRRRGDTAGPLRGGSDDYA